MALPLRLGNGTTILVETVPLAPRAPDEPSPGVNDLLPAGVAMETPAVQLPTKEFGEAVDVVKAVAGDVKERLGHDEKGMRLKELELGIKVGFDAKGNVFIASGSASASLELKLKWELKEAQQSEPVCRETERDRWPETESS